MVVWVLRGAQHGACSGKQPQASAVSCPVNHLQMMVGSAVSSDGSQGYAGTEIIFPAPAGHMQPLERIL